MTMLHQVACMAILNEGHLEAQKCDIAQLPSNGREEDKHPVA